MMLHNSVRHFPFKKKSLWQRKIKAQYKKNERNEKKRRNVTTDSCVNETMAQRWKKEETSDTREVISVHAFFDRTALHKVIKL